MIILEPPLLRTFAKQHPSFLSLSVDPDRYTLIHFLHRVQIVRLVGLLCTAYQDKPFLSPCWLRPLSPGSSSRWSIDGTLVNRRKKHHGDEVRFAVVPLSINDSRCHCRLKPIIMGKPDSHGFVQRPLLGSPSVWLPIPLDPLSLPPFQVQPLLPEG